MSGDCFHCGEPIPPGVQISVGAVLRTANGAEETAQVCCAGCEAAVMLIRGAGLDAYYRLRTERAPKADDRRRAEWSAYDRDAVQRGIAVTLPDGTREATLLVDGLRCAACSWLVEHALQRTAGVRTVRLNAATARLLLRWDPNESRLSSILAALAALGYTPHPLTAGAQHAQMTRERRALLKRLWVSGLGMMQVMMYAIAVYIGDGADLDAETRNLFNWVSLLITTPVVLYAAQPFFAGAWRGLRHRAPGMDLPIAVAILLAFTASVVVTLRGGAEVYFDSVAMFTFFLLTGRWFEMAARHKAGRMTEALGRLVPDTAERIHNVGAVLRTAMPNVGAVLRTAIPSEFVGALELNPGDHIRVRAGDRFPCDGTIVAGETEVDESLLTGESTPLPRTIGGRVIAGSLNLDAPVEVKVRSAGTGTLVSGIGRLLARAQGERPRIALLADRVARWFVVVVLALAVCTFAVWLQLDPARALPITLAVLVVACPCALALATPVALTSGTLALARDGLLVTRADALETLARADTIVFDKTGTLTHGDMRISGVSPVTGGSESVIRDALQIAAALERAAEHPIAKAFRPYDDGRPVRNLKVVRHEGVEGTVDGVRYRLGKGADATPGVVLSDGHGPIVSFALTDTVRRGAKALVDRLRADSIAVEMLSGDAEPAVAAVATELGIERSAARMSPEQKLARVRELQAAGHIVAVVGDGVNDAPVLAGADVAIALGSGSALAQSTAGMIVLGETPTPIATGFMRARRTLATIRQNLGLSLTYNLSAIPLAAAGFVPPWLAAIGMAASSLVVVLNSLKLYGPAR
ncbi:MAG: cadmium-translocating P-type ATPase [Xanthomonadaceae bacterium]|nr:cadmium-translocating P-type ATPase [Xanthomonadaceae bacterium]